MPIRDSITRSCAVKADPGGVLVVRASHVPQGPRVGSSSDGGSAASRQTRRIVLLCAPSETDMFRVTVRGRLVPWCYIASSSTPPQPKAPPTWQYRAQRGAVSGAPADLVSFREMPSQAEAHWG